MEYVGLAFPSREMQFINDELTAAAAKSDLKLIPQINSNIDIEVRGGVSSFISAYDIALLQIVRYSALNKNITSSDISQNLAEYFKRKSSADLIDFLFNNKHLLPTNYFLIFAFEWHDGDFVRYNKTHVDTLGNFFLSNNSWYFWLYDFEKKYSIPNLDIPLIIEIDNKIE